MTEKTKNIALQILSGTITFALCMGAWGTGFSLTAKGYMNVNRPLWTAVCIICAVLIVAIALFNIIGTKVISKRFSKMKMRELYNLSETLKSDTERDFKRAENSVRLTLTLAYAYLIAVILLILLCCFGTGVLSEGEESLTYSIGVIILAVFISWGPTDVFFTPLVKPDPPKTYLLDESEFPLIYSAAREAAEKLGCRFNIRIYCYGNGASITLYKRTAIIYLNYLYGALLTRDELTNVMLHEFAHIVNKDVNRGRAFGRAEQRFEGDGKNVITAFGKMLFLPLPATAVIFKTNIYETFASRYHEIEADKALKTLGNPQQSINALAKTRMVVLFNSVPHRELEYDFFAPEQSTGDYASQELTLFLKHRELHKEEWQSLLEKELPARVDSHPTFRNRMAALECEIYDAFRIETNPAYADEQKKIIETADRKIKEDMADNYADIRKNGYVKRKKVIDEYDEFVKNGKAIPENKLYEYIQAFFGVDDDIALELADKAANLPDPTIGYYYKANILFNRNDDGCIEYLKAVAKSTDNMDLAMSATSHIGEYALKTGNEELLKEYRSTSPEIVQASRDKGERTRFNKKSSVKKCDLGSEVIQSILKGLDNDILKGISAIYIGTYTDSDGNRHYPVAVRLKNRNSKNNYEVMQGVYDYFFGYNGKYDFIVMPTDNPLSRKVKKYGSLILENK